MTNTDALRALLARVEQCEAGGDRDLDAAIADTIGEDAEYPGSHLGYPDGRKAYLRVVSPTYTSSLNAAVALVERRLPGFWQSSGLCALTGHASIGPDYNGPDADRLRREWLEERFHEGFHADLAPGDGRHRQCLALVHCVLQAEIARV